MCVKSQCKSQVYVKDMRDVMLFHGRRLKYPKNYNKIVESGEIIKENIGSDETVLKLLYGEKDKNGLRTSWTLTPVVEDVCHFKAYYTMQGLLCDPADLHESYYEPFGFSRLDLRKFLPVIDVKRTDDPSYPYQIVNTLYLARKGCSASEESGEVNTDSRKVKGLNNKQMFNSFYGKRDPSFCVIRNESDKIEIDKTISIFPVCLFVYTIIFIRKILTFLPMKLGECLLRQKNIVAKVLGHIFFTPFVPLKFCVDLSAIIIKFPLLMFVADKTKYADKYYVLWKHEFKRCFHELLSDSSVIKDGNRPIVPDHDEYTLIGTWDELDAREGHHTKCMDLP